MLHTPASSQATAALLETGVVGNLAVPLSGLPAHTACQSFAFKSLFKTVGGYKAQIDHVDIL